MIKVALAEDNLFLAKNISDTLMSRGDVQLKFVANNGQQLLDELEKNSRLDLVVMDIEMPIMDGIEATRQVTERYPHIKVLISTVFDDDDNLFNAIKAGANGYLLKDEPSEKLFQSIDEIFEGGAPMSASIAQKTLKLLRSSEFTIEEAKDFNLTPRESEILEQLCHGLNYNKIADNLVISPKTVRKHIENVYQKLNVHSKMEALKVAQKNRLF